MEFAFGHLYKKFIYDQHFCYYACMLASIIDIFSSTIYIYIYIITILLLRAFRNLKLIIIFKNIFTIFYLIWLYYQKIYIF